MYHFVYQTTNTINNKKYIGKHSTNNLDDGYIGSGVALGRAIAKYGEQSFKREILKHFSTSEEALQYEASLVTEDIVNDKSYYNIRQGGEGGRYKYTDKDKSKMKESSQKRFKNSEGTCKGRFCVNNGIKNKFLKEGSLIPCGYKLGMVQPNRKSMKGCVVKPTTTGRIWVNNGQINKLVNPLSIQDGYVKGRLR